MCDNLFNADPYLQQGGDMVRTGGLQFRCNPERAMGERIDGLTLADGSRLDPKRNYKVAGWATVGAPSSGPPVWDVVAAHLRDRKVIRLDRFEQPELMGVSGNAGFEEYTP